MYNIFLRKESIQTKLRNSVRNMTLQFFR